MTPAQAPAAATAIDRSPARADLAPAARRAVWRPDLAPLAVGAAAFACALVGVRLPVIDGWWQLAYGRLILGAHALPRADVWSWTAAGHPLVLTEWAFDVMMAEAARRGPWAALALELLCLLPLGLCVFAAAARAARSRPVGGLAAVVLLGLLLPMEPLLPQLASFALFACVLWLLEAARLRGPAWLVPLPAVFAIWANVHGSFPLGWMLVAIETLTAWTPGLPGRLLRRCRRSTRRWLPAAAACSGAAAVANPYGWRLVPYVLRLASSPFHLANIAEFQSPNFHDPYLAWAVLPALLAGVAAVVVSRRRLPARDLIACGGLLAGTLVMVRLLPYALVMLAVLVAGLARARPTPARPAPWPLVGAVAAVVALALARVPPRAWPSAAGEPVAAAAYVRGHLAGRGFNTYEWGGYLESVWRGTPGVYVDSRGDMYAGTGVLERYLSIVEMRVDPGAELRGEGVQWALLPVGMPLARVLQAEGWGPVYADGVAVVLVPPG